MSNAPTARDAADHDSRNPQQPSGMPTHRYSAFTPVGLSDRAWPSRVITEAPDQAGTTGPG